MKRLKRRLIRIIWIIFILMLLILAISFIFYNKEILGKLSGLVISQIEKNNTSMLNNINNSNEIFIIENVTNEDILNDRIKITNTGSESINDIFVYVNGKKIGLMKKKIIGPGKSEYFYLNGIYPAGKVNLKVLYKDYSQETSFDVAEDWHIVPR